MNIEQKKRLKVLQQHLQTIRKEADKKGAHMTTNQYCTLRTVEDKLELYSGIVYEYEQFPNDATSQRKRELLSDYLDRLIEGINEQLQKS